MLLSLIPLSCIVALIRDLVNIYFSLTTSSSIHSNLYLILNMEEDIVMAPMKERTPEYSKNISRESSIISTTLSKPYHKFMEIQNLNPSWFVSRL